MTKVVSAVAARRGFGELLNRVALTHEDIVIERAGKKIARMVAVEDKTCAPQGSEGKLDFRDSAGLGKSLWRAIDVDRYLAGEREEWD